MTVLLEYLLFESTDEESGACSFDAMASVLPARVPELLREVEAVLNWACREFGEPSAVQENGEWDFELQAVGEHDAPLKIAYDLARQRVDVAQSPGRVTIALTVTGSPAFGTAFRDHFPESD
ncbi:hypothetical protein [Variovorax sp. KK3]|uniref:hypothetical protein n=1 Tax=Variovorax sp. KK3 TaxID=1855728 RepID=UPI001180B3F9|nr:hypothetical protein [Variovorax sp. KK3]